MSVRILEDGDGDHAVLYDSVTGIAFGPVFDGTDTQRAEAVAERFLHWFNSGEAADTAIRLGRVRLPIGSNDPRSYNQDDLVLLYAAWWKEQP